MIRLAPACNIKLQHLILCECSKCGSPLCYNPFTQNIFSGDKCYCGCCGTNVTELVYGKPKNKQNDTTNT